MLTLQQQAWPLLILADDLTGAADSAARVHAAGIAAQIVLSGACDSPGATALTSDSRHLPPARAAERVHAVVRAAGAGPGALWYKKIDSTLRGNIAAEISALLSATGRTRAIVCPAFPAQERGLLGGRLVAPGGPAFDLCALLESQAGDTRTPSPTHTVRLITLDCVRAGTAALQEQLATLAAQHAEDRGSLLIAVDALSDIDLATIEAATALALPDALRCGSAGLVGALAQRLAQDAGAPHARPPVPKGAQEQQRTLIVVGSGSSTAQRQLAYLRTMGAAQMIELASMSPARIAPGADTIVLHLPAPPVGMLLDGPQARAIAARLAGAAVSLIAAFDPALVALAGGDTAMGVLTRLGVARLQVLRELLPGMPLTHGVDAHGRARRFVLKPGAFGGDQTLAELVRLAAHSSS